MVQVDSKYRRSPFGHLLATSRASRGWTQLELSLRAGVSVRHISFLESGRSRPSEFMISCLATALQLEPAAEDRLRAAAGFAPRDARVRAQWLKALEGLRASAATGSG